MPDADELAFLRAICESPDDAPRLVFADWLDDHGQHTRAEYIRVQCELEPMRYEIDQPRVRQLLEREYELWHEDTVDWHGSAVAAAARTPCMGKPVHGPFSRRGVPELVAMSLDAFLAHGDAVLSAHPTIRELAVFDMRGRGAQLAASRAIERVDTLELADWISKEDAAALMASPSVRGRRVVRVWDTDLYTTDLYTGADEFVFAPWSADTAIEVVLFIGSTVTEFDREPFRRFEIPVKLLNHQEGPFLLRPNQTRNLYPGRLGDGRPVLVAFDRRGASLVFVVFDEAGHLTESWDRTNPHASADSGDRLLWLATEFGFRSELLWMRPFYRATQGLTMDTMSEAIIARFGYFTAQHDRSAKCSSTGYLWEWFHSGRYWIDWDGDQLFNRWTGETIT